MIEFSFIVPVYNVEDFVEKCLDSLVKQKANNFDYENLSTDGYSSMYDMCFKLDDITLITRLGELHEISQK